MKKNLISMIKGTGKTLTLIFAGFFISMVLVSGCNKDSLVAPLKTSIQTTESTSTHQLRNIYSGWPETMESGSKTSYSSGNVTLSSGSWNFYDALIGTSSSDHKNGAHAARIQNSGKLTMNFNLSNGATSVSVVHAKYGSDASSSWGLYYSTNNGSTWIQTGNNITTSSTTLSTATFTMSITGSVRFQIRKSSGGRLNIDDISVSDNGGGGTNPLDNDNIAMGNPSGAVTNVSFPNNYLLVKPQYDLAYNNSLGECGWVSWHLGSSDLGSTPRCDCFASDAQLPSGFFVANSSAYSGSGFDRGHQCPSADRTDNSTNNAATFLMTNMLPQSPNLNQITWAALEDYERALVNQGNELFIICGGYGTGGTGSNGSANSVNGGNINVPAHCWKVIVVLPNGNNDINRVSSATRVIAVDMPNVQTVNSQTWGYYRTSVDAIEAATGYDFLSNISTSIQSSVESIVDNGPTQ